MQRTMFRSLTLSLVVLAGWQITHAQTLTINSTVYRDKVRFESQEQIKELRVEVFNASGQKLFDSGFVGGQTLDWNMLNQEGQPVADGVYDYLVTTTKRSSKESELQSGQLSILREGQDLGIAPALVQPSAPIAKKIKGNRFSIKTNEPNVEVSWQVTGVRSDPTARKYPLDIEETKVERERGYYLNPDAYGQPEERGIEWARSPDMMQRLKQRRIESEQKLKRQSH